MTIPELLAELQKQITQLEADNALLKSQLPPTGLVKVVIMDVDMSKVTFS